MVVSSSSTTGNDNQDAIASESLSSLSINRCMNALNLEVLVDRLVRLVRSDNPKVTNNICQRFACMALRCFLPTLMRTRHASYGLEILVNLLHLKHSTYNLVKCELVDLLASIDFKYVVYAEQTMPYSKR